MNLFDSHKRLSATALLISSFSQPLSNPHTHYQAQTSPWTWARTRSESQPSLPSITTVETTIASLNKQAGTVTAGALTDQPLTEGDSCNIPAEQLQSPIENTFSFSWMQDLDSENYLNGSKEKGKDKDMEKDASEMTNHSAKTSIDSNGRRPRQDSSNNNNKSESRNNHNANIRLPPPPLPPREELFRRRRRLSLLPTSKSTPVLETSKFTLSNLSPSSLFKDRDFTKDNNDNKDVEMMIIPTIPSYDNGGNGKVGKVDSYTASTDNTTVNTAQQAKSSLPTPPTSLPLVRTQLSHPNRHQHQTQQGQQQSYSHQLYHDPYIMQQVTTRSDPSPTTSEPPLSSCASTTTTSTTTTTATATTTATIRTSVDLSALITAPTKVHLDHMGRDERSKILASLQLAIERAQAYRDEILDKDREVLHGGATGKTQGHGTYFQQEQQQNNHGYYQDTGYPGNNMNEAKHHQYQRQYQSHNKNNRNENHQQHQHYNDLHNNIRPHFQNHHYHPPLSPGPGTASTCMSAPSYPPYYDPHQHVAPNIHPVQQQHQFPYLSKCHCLNHNTARNDQLPPLHAKYGPDTLSLPTATTFPQSSGCGSHSGPSLSPIPCPAIELLLRASAQSTEARATEEQRNMIRTKWAAILYTVISTLGILFACALDEKTSDRITFVVMYLLGLIVPIYALVDFGITRSQRLRDTDASAATAAAAAIAVASGGSSGGTAFSNNVPMTTSSNSSTIAESTNTSSASTSKETKNRDEEAFHTGAFIHHI